MLWDDLIPFPSIVSPFEGHHDSETNGEVENNIVDRIENPGEGEGVDLGVDIVRPHEDSCHAVVKDRDRSEHNVTDNIRLISPLFLGEK